MGVDLKTGIVRVLRADGATSGTGFVVSEEGLIATCAHVVGSSPPADVEVVFYTGDHGWATVEPDWWRPADAEDVAILRLDGPLPEGVAPLPLGSSVEAIGRTFHTFGFPEVASVEGMGGKCEVIEKTVYQGYPVLQLRSTEITRGFSGAPIWDEELGVVAGMVTCITEPDEYGRLSETAYVIPVETLREICPLLRLPEECPYRGLSAFDVKEADLYFGRKAATDELLGALEGHDVVLLVGVSGRGKSSLVRAGLEKGLQVHQVPGLAERARCICMPGRHPMFNLVLALAALPGLGQERVAKAFGFSPVVLAEEGEARRKTAERLDRESPGTLAKALVSLVPGDGLLLIVDQFERLYTECSDKDQDVRNRFVDTLLEAAGDAIKVLLALRADFYGRALEHSGFERVVKEGGQVTLGRMNKEELRAAIEKPARLMKRVFQPGLVDQLVADVEGQAGDLPLLQFALTELWERDNQKGVLTQATYESLGYRAPDGQIFAGVQGAIAQRAETLWSELTGEEQQAAQRIFVKLIVPGGQGEGEEEDAGRRAWQLEWDEATQRVAQKLVDARLLVTGRAPVTGQPTVEAAHEALIRAWPRLRRWASDYRPFIQWYNRELVPFLHRWLDSEQPSDLLLPESRLPVAQEWLKEYEGLLKGSPAEYIQASIEKAREERRARERRRRWLVLGLATGLVVALALALVAWTQRNEAVARELAAASLYNLDKDPELSVLLALESVNRAHTFETEDALRRSLLASHLHAVLSDHKGAVYAVRYSPDGQLVASAGSDGIVRIWNPETWKLVNVLPADHLSGGQPVAALTAAFDPGGSLLAVGYAGGTIKIWDVNNALPVAVLNGHKNDVWSVDFSPDGALLVSADGDGVVRLWMVPSGSVLAKWCGSTPLQDSPGCSADLSVAKFSPDGKYILTAGADGTARLWNVATKSQVASFGKVEDGLTCAALSPDGQLIATGGRDNLIRVWDAASRKLVVVLRGHKGWLRSVVFSRDGSRVVSSGDDGTVRVWKVSTGEEELVLPGSKWSVLTADVSPDGRWMVSGSDISGIIRIWDTSPDHEVAVLLGHKPRKAGMSQTGVTDVAFNPVTNQLLSFGADGTVRLWNPMTGQVEAVIGKGEGVTSITAVSYALGGASVVTGHESGKIHIWDSKKGKELASLDTEDKSIRTLGVVHLIG